MSEVEDAVIRLLEIPEETGKSLDGVHGEIFLIVRNAAEEAKGDENDK